MSFGSHNDERAERHEAQTGDLNPQEYDDLSEHVVRFGKLFRLQSRSADGSEGCEERVNQRNVCNIPTDRQTKQRKCYQNIRSVTEHQGVSRSESMVPNPVTLVQNQKKFFHRKRQKFLHKKSVMSLYQTLLRVYEMEWNFLFLLGGIEKYRQYRFTSPSAYSINLSADGLDLLPLLMSRLS